MTEALRMVAPYSLYRVLTLTALTYKKSFLNDESTPDGHSYSLYGCLP